MKRRGVLLLAAVSWVHAHAQIGERVFLELNLELSDREKQGLPVIGARQKL